MIKKQRIFPFFILLTALLASSTVLVAQKKSSNSKGSARGTLAADTDCSVKVNGASKLFNVKAYTPLDVTLKVGENTIEATSADKTATYRNTIVAKNGEKIVVEISFFEDSKFLEYIKTGNVNMVKSSIKKNPGLVDNKDGDLVTTPLQVAIENSQPEIVSLLMDNGASYLKPVNIYPLHLSIKFASSTKTIKDKPAPDIQLVDYFLKKGCTINDRDENGNTPLHVAVKAGKIEVVEKLIKMGADVKVKNDYDESPLKIAEEKGLISIIKVLEVNGAKVTKVGE